MTIGSCKMCGKPLGEGHENGVCLVCRDKDANAAKWEDDGEPNLGNLLERLRKAEADPSMRADAIKKLYSKVARGKLSPRALPDNVLVLACQAMVILFKEVGIRGLEEVPDAGVETEAKEG